MIITSQMIRDVVGFNGPMTLWDLEAKLNVKTEKDRILMLAAKDLALNTGRIRSKVIKIEFSEHMVYFTDWNASTPSSDGRPTALPVSRGY